MIIINDLGQNVITYGSSNGDIDGGVGTSNYWTPSQLSDLNLWFDSSQLDTLTLSTGNKIIRWNCRERSTYFAAQTGLSISPTLTTYPDVSLPLARFQASASQRMFLSGSDFIPFLSGGYIAIVARVEFLPGTGNSPRLLSYWNNINDGWAVSPLSAATDATTFPSRIGIRKQGTITFTNFSPNSTFPITGTELRIHGGVWGTEATNSRLMSYINGVSSTSINTSVTEPITATPGLPITIASDALGNRLTGAIGEIIMCNASTNVPLPDSTRQKIEGYLAWKWNLTSSLPANHPYKTIPPRV